MAKFPEATKEQLALARERVKKAKAADKKPSKTDKLLTYMADGKWHTGYDLATTISWRFGGYLHELKKRGVAWEKERIPDVDDVVFKYRLVKVD